MLCYFAHRKLMRRLMRNFSTTLVQTVSSKLLQSRCSNKTSGVTPISLSTTISTTTNIRKGPNLAPGGSYLEIARCLNFWQQSGLKNFSLQLEYHGGITRSYPINNAWLFGVDYFIHSKDYKNTLNLKALYKTIRKKTSDVPMQLTAVWAMNDLFGIKGLKFNGFADFWWEDHTCFKSNGEAADRSTIFITEPQVWYNVGQHIGVDNLSLGTEIELSNNFGSTYGFKCRPCLGVKWNF